MGFLRLALVLCLISSPVLAGKRGGIRTSLPDNTNYTIGTFPNTGQFIGFLGAFGGTCAGTLGVNYADSMSINASTFPNNSVINWQWPNNNPQSCGFGVWAFLQIAYGNYSGGTFMQVTAKQVNAISTLKVDHSIRVGGASALDNFDVIDDMFLTTTSGGSTHATEIEFFYHVNTSAKTFFNGGTPIGTLTLNGQSWSVSQQPSDILFMKTDQTDCLSCSVDMKAAFSYLISQGKLTGSEWYNGHGLGVEPTLGSGTMAVDQLSVVYN